jgi:chemotaxis protein histidine kinase CheA
MHINRKLKIKNQLLDEANYYLNTLETVLLEIKTNCRIEVEKINAVLRAIHYIKGGASMMGFRTLTDLAHRLEDSFQVLKSRINCLELDSDLHSLLLSAIDWLRHVLELLSTNSLLDEQWLATLCYPAFEELHERLGNPIPQDAMSMFEEELLSLIFEPGFTTKEEVTTLSGGSMGMDVVGNNLKKVQAYVKVNTVQGVGTTFTLSVPLGLKQKLPETLIYGTPQTLLKLKNKSLRKSLPKSYLSLVRVVLVESNQMLLAFTEDVVKEIFLLQNELVFSVAGREVLNWQGTMLPLVRLGRYLQFNCQRYDNLNLETLPAMNGSKILIIKNGNQSVAVQLDRCWGEQEVAIRKVEGNISLPAGFDKCTILGDGRIVPLVNASELLNLIISPSVGG